MKVAIFKEGVLLPPRDGATVRIVSLARQLVRHGVEVIFLHCNRGQTPARVFAEEHFTTCLLTPDQYYNPTTLSVILAKEKPDLIQANDPEFIMTTGRHLADRLGSKLCFEAHNSDFTLLQRLGYPKRSVNLMRFKEYCAATLADAVFCVSKVDASCYVKIGIPRGKIRVIPNGASTRTVPSGRTHRGNFILFVGNMFYEPNRKAVKVICRRIFPALRKRLPRARIVFVGLAPQSLVKSYQKPGLEFVGAVSREVLNKYLDEAWLGLNPITSGSGTRLKVLDYLAAGLPVLSTTLGVEGLDLPRRLIVLENRFAKYPKLIASLHNDKNRLELMSIEGKRLVARRFDWQIIARKLKRAYEEIT